MGIVGINIFIDKNIWGGGKIKKAVPSWKQAKSVAIKQIKSPREEKSMSKNFKRLIGVLMVAAMISAMAVACSSKDEAAGADDSKTETTVAEENEKDDEQEDANRPPEEEAAEAVESEREVLTEEDVEALKASIKNAVLEEYIKPNGIDPASFSWPGDGSDVWLYFDQLKMLYSGEKFMGGAPDVEVTFTDSPEKSIMDATYNGFVKWHESSGVNNYKFFENAISMMSVEWFNSIDITAE